MWQKLERRNTKLEVRSLKYFTRRLSVAEVEVRGTKLEVRGLFDSVIFPSTEAEVLEAEVRS